MGNGIFRTSRNCFGFFKTGRDVNGNNHSFCADKPHCVGIFAIFMTYSAVLSCIAITVTSHPVSGSVLSFSKHFDLLGT